MNRFVSAFALLTLVIVPACTRGRFASEPSGATMTGAARFVGRYVLQLEPRTQSELDLATDGSFHWTFANGDLNAEASGRWHAAPLETDPIEAMAKGGGLDCAGAAGDQVSILLDVEKFSATNDYDAMKFDRMELCIENTALLPVWPWGDGGSMGRYVRD